MLRYPLLRLWQFWLASALFGLPAALLVTALFAPGVALLARFNTVITTHPGGGLWVLYTPSTVNRPFLVGYEVHGTTMIITHKADGTATVDVVVPNLRLVAAPVSFHTASPARVLPGAPRAAALPAGRSALISLWFLLLMGTIPAAFLIRTAWRLAAAPSTCRTCGYALAGLPPGSPCPECGSRPRPPG